VHGMRIWLVLAMCACGASDPTATHALEFGGDRPATLKPPLDLTAQASFPLLMVLHGYGASGVLQAGFFEVGTLPSQNEAFLVAPDGLVDSTGAEYWNADPACCDFDHTGVDDSAYLGTLLDDIMVAWPEIDPTRVFVLGHSNGGFMAYRLACDRADIIASIGVLAGDAPTVACAPSYPVSLLHMHGTADDMVPYAGAATSLAQWAGYDGCQATRTAAGMLDLEARLDGAETTDYVEDGCPANVAMEFWSIAGGSHLPSWTTAFEPAMWSWFSSHHR
jgi:polyhydroxybutyrate depolymerase